MMYLFDEDNFDIPASKKIFLDAGIFILTSYSLDTQAADFLKKAAKKKCTFYTNALAYAEASNRIAKGHFYTDICSFLSNPQDLEQIVNKAYIKNIVDYLSDDSSRLSQRRKIINQQFLAFKNDIHKKINVNAFYNYVYKAREGCKWIQKYEYIASGEISRLNGITSFVEVLPNNNSTIGQARRLMRKYNLLLNDAINFISFNSYKIDYFLTTDSDFNKITNVSSKIINLKMFYKK